MKTIKNKLALALIAAGLSFSVTAADLKLGYASDPVSLDPHEQLSGGTLQLSHMVFDPLVRFTQKMDFEPRLAQSWERIDANTFRFTLRQGVKFHSGNPLTADDVIWTFNRLQASPDFKAIFEPYSEMKKLMIIPSILFQKALTHWCFKLQPTFSQWIASFTAVKPQTVKIKLKLRSMVIHLLQPICQVQVHLR